MGVLEVRNIKSQEHFVSCVHQPIEKNNTRLAFWFLIRYMNNIKSNCDQDNNSFMVCSRVSGLGNRLVE